MLTGFLADPPRRETRPLVSMLSKPLVYGAFIPTVSILNALMGMLLPKLMTPQIFGEYALVVTLFQYGLIFDVGVGQLIDRWIPAALGRRQSEDADRLGQHLLWLRLYIGVVVFFATAVTLAILADLNRLPFSFGLGLLSATAGILNMIALGPSFIYRASSARRNYALTTGIPFLGLFLARPLGLIGGGLTGCFLALAVWYLAFAVLFYWLRPLRLSNRPSMAQSTSFVIQGLPFFATSFVWAFYMTANRWFAINLIEPGAFGHFAFSTNIYSLLVGFAGILSAFYYPRIVGRIASGARFAVSRTLMTDFSKLTIGAGGVCGLGIVLAAPLLGWIYPQYHQSVVTMRILLAAVPAMALVSWLMPVSLSSGRRPWVDGLLVYPLATAILYLAIHALSPVFGISGIAEASTISALPLTAMQLAQLRHAHVVTTSAATAIFCVASLVTLGLHGLNWIVP
jgi:O-antigen/teichoic acid export membrane protein